MKKIISYILGLGLLITACNPMEDIYDGIDAKEITNVVEGLEITLADDDYDEMGGDAEDYHYFSENILATDYIPDFLSEAYPALTEGSSIVITYNYKNEADYLDIYGDATSYTLTDEDYSSVSATVGVAGYFSPSNPADDYLSSILDEAITDATDGDLCIVKYDYSDIDPEAKELQETTVFEMVFSSDLGEFQTVNVTGEDQSWYWSSYSGQGYAKMSGYSGGAVANEDWLISPAIDLSDYSSSTMNFTQTTKYINDQWEQIGAYISTDYDGSDPTAATWTELTESSLPSGNDYTFVNSGNIDISAFDGQTIYIGFKYTSSESNAATWEITDVEVTGVTAVTKSGIIAEAISLEELYVYDSGWEKSEDAYYLTVLDYDAMGESYGEPGYYNNFSSSIYTQDYLPQLAELKYPYAQEDDTTIFVYKYYSDGLQTKADKLFFTDGEWQVVIDKTDQYILTESSGWVFDPTVYYTMLSEDYLVIVDYVKSNISTDYVDSYGTAEDYYGASAYYSEFRINDGYFDADVFDSWEDAVTEAIGDVFLPSKFPDATTQQDGIDIYYVVTFAAYAGSMVDHTITFQCTKEGPNPEFTYSEGPIEK